MKIVGIYLGLVISHGDAKELAFGTGAFVSERVEPFSIFQRKVTLK